MAAAPHTTQPPEAPRKPHVLGAWLAFDPDETLAQFFARRADALAAGDQAWREGKIKAHHQKLYERLVDAVGAHQYSWIKVETLADEFKANESTIKRWLTVLEKQAKLIRRQRQFKTSSRTYLIAYDQRQVQTASNDQAQHGANDEATPPPAVPEEPADTIDAGDQMPPTDAATDAQASDAEALFFEREDAPTQSANVRPEVKDLPLNTLSDSGSSFGVNGGEHTFDITNIDPNIRGIIDDEGVNSDHGQQIVAARPHDELRAVQQYLDDQHNVRDRPGLFVWLNERDFGAQLLEGRAHAASKRQSTLAPPQAAARRRRAPRKQSPLHTDRPDRDYQCGACGHISAYLGIDDPFCDACGVHPGDELGKNDGLLPDPALWTTILNQLRVDHMHHQEWLATAMIAQYEEFVVLACPHKRVRDTIRMWYLDQINAIASEVLGRPVTVDLTVKYMPHTSEQLRKAWEDGEEQNAFTLDDIPHASTFQRSQGGDELWAKLVAYIKPPIETYAFFDRCYVAHHTAEQFLVIATPNCIVRDELHDTWLPSLQDAAAAVLGQVGNIEFMIDSKPSTISRAAAQPVCSVPTLGEHDEAWNTPAGEHVPAASGCESNAGQDARHREPDALSAEECERVWRSIPWRLPIAATERAMWFPHTRLHQCVNGHATVTAPTGGQVDQLTRCQDMIKDELALLLGRPITVAIVAAHAATARTQQEHAHNHEGTSGAADSVSAQGELDTSGGLDDACVSACERTAPVFEEMLQKVSVPSPPQEVAQATHDPPKGYAAVWEQVIAHLRLDGEERRTWLDPALLIELNNGRAVVAVPSIFIRRAIEHRYRTELEVALGTLLNRSVRIDVLVTKQGVPNV